MKIEEILSQDKQEREKVLIKRKIKLLKRGQEELVDSIKAEIEDLKFKREDLLSAEGLETPSWNTTYQELNIDLIMAEKRLEIAQNTLKELF